MAQVGHNNVDHLKNKSRGFFVIVTGAGADVAVLHVGQVSKAWVLFRDSEEHIGKATGSGAHHESSRFNINGLRLLSVCWCQVV